MVWLEVQPLQLAFEDMELVAENQDLDLVGLLGAQRKHGDERRREISAP